MTTSPTLTTFLTTHAPKLSLSSASKILTLDPKTHLTLTTFCTTHLPPTDQPTITLHKTSTTTTSNPATPTTNPSSWPHPENAYTHIFAALSPDLQTSVRGLKCIHYSLLWKGVAVVLASEDGTVGGERVDFGKLVELGGFEAGKVRVVDVEGVEVCFAMKWDMLTA